MSDPRIEARRRARRARIKERGADEVLATARAMPDVEVAKVCPYCFGHGKRVEQGTGWVVCATCEGSGRRQDG